MAGDGKMKNITDQLKKTRFNPSALRRMKSDFKLSQVLL